MTTLAVCVCVAPARDLTFIFVQRPTKTLFHQKRAAVVISLLVVFASGGSALL